jgi:hypothetical protein
MSSNVFNIYRFIGHIHAMLRTDITRDFERGIENTRIQFILSRITEDEFKQHIYKHYTTKNKRTINNRLVETVHVVGVDLIQRYCNMFDPSKQYISIDVAYELTYKLIQEFNGIIKYLKLIKYRAIFA